MVEFRRIDPERIPPAPAGEHPARVEIDRRHPEQHPDPRGRRHPDEAAETVPPADEDKPTITYDPEGHLEEHPAPGRASHQIDFTA